MNDNKEILKNLIAEIADSLDFSGRINKKRKKVPLTGEHNT
jgi:hypothetical protein